MLLALLFLSRVLADVAYVQFQNGDITGTVRFEQDDGSSDVSIISNLVDTSNTHGSTISWSVYSDYINTTMGQTCADKGTLVYDLSSLLLAEVRFGASQYSTSSFSVADLYETSLQLGSDISCSGIYELLAASRVIMNIEWTDAVNDTVTDVVKSLTADTFNVSTSHVVLVSYYRVRAYANLTNVPTSGGTTNAEIESYLSDAIPNVLDLKSYETLDVTVTDTNSATEKQVYFVVTTTDIEAQQFYHDQISNAPSFGPQVSDGMNFLASLRESIDWRSLFEVHSVDEAITLAVTTTDVKANEDVVLDIGALIPGLAAQILSETGGVLTSYEIHEETSAPTATPTNVPSTSPSRTPSNVPTTTPTYAPSLTPTSAPSCGDTLSNYLGDPLIQLQNAHTTYAANTLSLVVGFPLKYSMVAAELEGDSSNTYDWPSNWSNQQEQCLKLYTVDIPWASVLDGSAGLTWVGATNTFDGRLNLQLSETVTKTGSQTLGDTFNRDISLQMPFSVVMHTSIVVSTNVTIQIDGATLEAKALNGLIVIAPTSGSNAQVTVTFCTEVPFPWQLDETQFTISDTNSRVVGGTETLNETSSNNCNVLGSNCEQCWTSSWESNSVCGQQTGDYTIGITAQYLQVPPYVDEEVVNVGMTLSLLPSCVSTVATVDPIATLSLSPDNSYTTTASLFYIDDEAFGRIQISAIQDIESATLNTLEISQDGVAQNLKTTTFEYASIPVTRTDNKEFEFKFSFRLAISDLRAELNGKQTTVLADVTLTYSDGTRRRLTVSNSPATEHTLQKDFVLLRTPCLDPPAHRGQVDFTSCENDAVATRLCKTTGWESVSTCDNTEDQTENMLGDDLIEESSGSSTSIWMIATISLVCLTILGLLVWKFYPQKAVQKDTWVLAA